jgi:hypothetical protein
MTIWDEAAQAPQQGAFSGLWDDERHSRRFLGHFLLYSGQSEKGDFFGSRTGAGDRV